MHEHNNQNPIVSVITFVLYILTNYMALWHVDQYSNLILSMITHSLPILTTYIMYAANKEKVDMLTKRLKKFFKKKR